MTLTSDERSQDRAGIAVSLTDPLVIAAREALGEQPAGTLLGGSGFAATASRDSDESGVAPGDHILEVSCAGTGTLQVTLAIDAAQAERTIVCSDQPTMVRVELSAPTGGAALSVELTPDADAVRQAGFAYRVRRAAEGGAS